VIPTADGKVTYEITGDNSSFKKSVEETESIANEGGKKIEANTSGAAKVAGAALAGIGASAVIAGKQAIDMGKDYESSLAKASTLFGDVNVDADNLSDGMLELSNRTGLAASALGDSLYNALSAGVPATEDMSEALDYLEGSAQLAKAGFTDIDTASSATIKTLNAYGLGLEDADRIQKVLMQTQNKGITTVGELGSVLAQVTPTAAAMGVNFEQVGASLALMTAKGTSTAQATTQLNGLLAELGKSGTTADKNFRKAAEGTKLAGMSFSEAMDAGYDLSDVLKVMDDYASENNLSMLDMFSSIEAGKAALAISGDIEGFNENLDAMGTSMDVVSEAADKISATTEDQMNVALNTLKNTLIELYQNVLQPLVVWLADAINWVSEHKEVIVAVTIAIAGLLAGIVAATSGATILASVAGILSGALAAVTSPVFLIIAAITALIAAGYLLYKHWDEVKAWATKIWDSISKFFTETFNNIKEFTSKIWGDITSFFKKTWDDTKNTATNVWSSVKDFFSNTMSSIKNVATNVWNAIKDFFSQIWEGIKNTFNSACQYIGQVFNNFLNIVKNIWNAVKQIFQGIIDFIAGVFTGNWQRAWQGISNIFEGIANGFKAIFAAPINWIIDKLNNFIAGVNQIQIPDWVPGVGGKGLNIPYIPRLKVGMDFIPSDMFPAYLHKGEAVLTAGQANVWRAAGRETGILSMLKGGISSNQASFTISKIADSITVRDDSDIDKISEALYLRIVGEQRGRGMHY